MKKFAWFIFIILGFVAGLILLFEFADREVYAIDNNSNIIQFHTPKGIIEVDIYNVSDNTLDFLNMERIGLDRLLEPTIKDRLTILEAKLK